MNTMEYMGYVAKIEYDHELKLFCGTVINAVPNTFYGASVDELEKEFACTMEEYFKFCDEKGVEQKKPQSEMTGLIDVPKLQS